MKQKTSFIFFEGLSFGENQKFLKKQRTQAFKQGVPWYSGNYRVWIHSEKRTWHDKKIQSVKKITFTDWKIAATISLLEADNSGCLPELII